VPDVPAELPVVPAEVPDVPELVPPAVVPPAVVPPAVVPPAVLPVVVEPAPLLEPGVTFRTKPLPDDVLPLALPAVLPLVPVAPADELIESRCRQPVTVMRSAALELDCRDVELVEEEVDCADNPIAKVHTVAAITPVHACFFIRPPEHDSVDALCIATASPAKTAGAYSGNGWAGDWLRGVAE
jgi:hypothetical protein